MPDSRSAAQRLTRALAAADAARLALHHQQERLAQAARQLGVDPDTAAALASQRDQIAAARQDVSVRVAEVMASAQTYEPFADPRTGVTELDASVPALLFPIRMETRFQPATAGTAAQLWVRLYPDDCLVDTFEPTLAESELARVRDFWVAWAAAGGVIDQERGAWRVLAGQFGSGRAAYLMAQHRPTNLETLPAKAQPADVHLVVVVDQPLPAVEATALDGYWQAVWHGDQDQARAGLIGAVGAARAGQLIAGHRPANLDQSPPSPAASARTVFLLLPDPATVPTQRLAWSRPAVATVLPERFVVLGFRDGVEVLHEIGALIPTPLSVGPNPLAPPAEQIRPDGGDLDLGPDLRWLADFEEAVRIGMGLRIDLSDADARAGFDELLAVGIRLSADPAQGQALVQDLFQHHQHSATGFALLPTGSATNNTETRSAAYRAGDDADSSFELAAGKLPPLRRADEHVSRSDGQWLADALGLDLSTFEQTANGRGRDQTEARAMNTALWPATWGYFMDSMMGPVFTPATVELTRWYFTRLVTGRGLVPAVRIGRQPYGILPVTAFDRMRWLVDGTAPAPAGLAPPPGFASYLANLAGVFDHLRADWARMAGQVAHVGAAGDPHQTLLDIVGLSPASVEYHRRWAQSLEQLTNRLNLAGLGGFASEAFAAMQYARSGMDLLNSLGYTGATVPELLEKFFLDNAVLLTGDLVDDQPLSAIAPIRAWTPEGDNYIGWLVTAAQTSFDRVRQQAGFIADRPPTALLYLLLRYAVEQGYFDAGVRLLAESGQLSTEQVRAARIDPSFIHVADPPSPAAPVARIAGPAGGLAKPLHTDRPSESRYELLYRAAPGAADQLVADRIPAVLQTATGAAHLREQLDALRLLEDTPTARLEGVLAEHLDLASYRLDAWRWGLLHYQLALLREGPSGGLRTGVYVGGYGWLRNVRPNPGHRQPAALTEDLAAEFNPPGTTPATVDPGNQGFIHAPSLNHAVAAAVLRSGYLSGLDPTRTDALAVDLTSRRVRGALELLDGLRSGQSLGALLGYRLERGLHDGHSVAEVDRFIYALRAEFPLVANRLTDTAAAPGQPIQAIEASNVVDGLALTTHVRATGQADYPFGKALPPADPDQAAAINTEVRRLLDGYDAVADVASSEAVFQAVQGNYDRLAGALDAFGGLASQPPDPQVLQTPRRGIGLTHRVGIHLVAGLDPMTSPVAAIATTARSHAEPALNGWLAGVLPAPDHVTCLVDHAVVGTGPQTVTVSQQALGLQPIDLLYVIGDGPWPSLDERIEDYVRHTAGLRPDATVTIRYRDAAPGTVSWFETGALVRSLRGLVLRSRPLDADDLTLGGQPAGETAVAVDPQRIQRPLDWLRQLVATGPDHLTRLAGELEPLLADPAANRAVLAAHAEAWAGRYLALARVAADFGAGRAIGPVLEAQQQAYEAARTALDEVLTRWDQRLTAFAAAVASARGLPADERIAALRRAERLVSTAYTAVEPATPNDYEALLTGLRDAFAAKRAELAQLRAAPPPTAAGLLDAIAAAQPIDRFDGAGIDVAPTTDRLVGLAAEVATRLRTLAADITDRAGRAAAALAAVGEPGASLTPADHAAAAAKALFGEDFVLIPEVTLPATRAAELANAWADRESLLRHLAAAPPAGLGVDFPVDDWLYGAARVREKLALWEHLMVTTEAFGRPAPELTPLQLPYRPGDAWLGLRFPPSTDLAGERLAYTAHFVAPYDPAERLCGLLLDEWTEVLPAAEETTGIAFHYNRPGSEPPQVMLLALAPRLSGAWQWPDLVDAVRGAFVEAEMRAVEPAHIDAEPHARFLPAAIMAATAHPITIGLNLAVNVAMTEVANG